MYHREKFGIALLFRSRLRVAALFASVYIFCGFATSNRKIHSIDAKYFRKYARRRENDLARDLSTDVIRHPSVFLLILDSFEQILDPQYDTRVLSTRIIDVADVSEFPLRSSIRVESRLYRQLGL